MDMKPFFSIIIPSLNEENYLPNLLKDLKTQTFKNFQVILVDGHSEDQTIKKAKEFKDDLNLTIINSQKRHISIQRNLGAKKAQGKYWLFIDADSRIPKYFLVGIKYQCEKNQPDVFTNYLTPDTQIPQDKLAASVMNLGLETMSNFKETAWALGAFIGCRPAVFKKISGFDKKLKYGEDRIFIRDSLKNGFEFIVFKEPRFTYSFRRIRKEGKLNLLYQSTKLTLRIINKQKNLKNLAETYPMLGGSFYQQKPKKTKLNKKLEKAFEKIVELFSQN